MCGTLLIVRYQRLSWIQVLNFQNCNQCLNCQKSLICHCHCNCHGHCHCHCNCHCNCHCHCLPICVCNCLCLCIFWVRSFLLIPLGSLCMSKSKRSLYVCSESVTGEGIELSQTKSGQLKKGKDFQMRAFVMSGCVPLTLRQFIWSTDKLFRK